MPKAGKTHKATAKRIKLTKKGKLKHRKCGQDHFNARDNAKRSTNKKRDNIMSDANAKTIKTALGK